MCFWRPIGDSPFGHRLSKGRQLVTESSLVMLILIPLLMSIVLHRPFVLALALGALQPRSLSQEGASLRRFPPWVLHARGRPVAPSKMMRTRQQASMSMSSIKGRPDSAHRTWHPAHSEHRTWHPAPPPHHHTPPRTTAHHRTQPHTAHRKPQTARRPRQSQFINTPLSSAALPASPRALSGVAQSRV